MGTGTGGFCRWGVGRKGGRAEGRWNMWVVLEPWSGGEWEGDQGKGGFRWGLGVVSGDAAWRRGGVRRVFAVGLGGCVPATKAYMANSCLAAPDRVRIGSFPRPSRRGFYSYTRLAPLARNAPSVPHDAYSILAFQPVRPVLLEYQFLIKTSTSAAQTPPPAPQPSTPRSKHTSAAVPRGPSLRSCAATCPSASRPPPCPHRSCLGPRPRG